MGLLDRLKRKPPAAVPQAQKLSVEQLPLWLGTKRQSVVGEQLPAIRTAARSLYESIEPLSAQIGQLAKRLVELDKRVQKIAIAQRDNFCSRSLQLLPPAGEQTALDFDQLQQLHSKSAAALAGINKITADNRYLFAFFESDMAEIGRALKRFSDAINSLGAAISSTQQQLRPVYEAERLLAEWFAAGRQIENQQKTIKQLQERVFETVQFDAAALQAARSEFNTLMAQLSQADSAINEAILGLERPLRKYSHSTADKKLQRAITRYLENPLAAIQEDADLAQLREMLAGLHTFIATGGADLKNLEKDLVRIDAMADSLKSQLQATAALRQQSGVAKAKLEQLESLQTKVRAIESEKATNATQIAHAQSEIAEQQGQQKRLFDQLQKQLGEIGPVTLLSA